MWLKLCMQNWAFPSWSVLNFMFISLLMRKRMWCTTISPFLIYLCFVGVCWWMVMCVSAREHIYIYIMCVCMYVCVCVYMHMNCQFCIDEYIIWSQILQVLTLPWTSTGTRHWLAPVIIAFFLLLLPLWVTICIKNKYTNDVIYTGWTPVLSAMVISRYVVCLHVCF